MLVGRGGETPALAGGECYRRPANCFESPAEFDLLAHGRKIAGAAMRRTRNGLLLQGSLREIPGLEDLRTGIAAVFGGKVDTRVILPAELADAESLSRSKYETSGWTRRV
jgi:lipoate-protein ligase A